MMIFPKEKNQLPIKEFVNILLNVNPIQGSDIFSPTLLQNFEKYVINKPDSFRK